MISRVGHSELKLNKDIYLQKIQSSNLISIDIEFSGMDYCNIKDMNIRYLKLKESVFNRSIFSIGISFFEEGDTTVVTTIDLMVLSMVDFVFSAKSFLFLVQSSFDFQAMRNAIMYMPASRRNEDLKKLEFSEQDVGENCDVIKELLLEIGKKRVVFHNGLIDLIFLYSAFINELPASLDGFIAQTHLIFPSVYDTKYIAVKLNEKRTYLYYLYKKLKRSSSLLLTHKVIFLEEIIIPQKTEELCINYNKFGYCMLGDNCPNIHNLEMLINIEHPLKRKGTEIEHTTTKKFKLNPESEDPPDNTPDLPHNSGFDAYITGYIFLKFTEKAEISQFENMVYLTGKTIPLKLFTSRHNTIV